MDKSSSAKCLLYSDVVKGEPSPTGRGRRSRDDQGVGDIRFTNILQLFSIHFFFLITLLYHFFSTLFLPTTFTHTHDPRPLPTTSTHDPRPTTFSYTRSMPFRAPINLTPPKKVTKSGLAVRSPFTLSVTEQI